MYRYRCCCGGWMFIQTRKKKHSNIDLSPRCVKLSGCKFKIISTVNLTQPNFLGLAQNWLWNLSYYFIWLTDWLVDWDNVVLSDIQSLASVYRVDIHLFIPISCLRAHLKAKHLFLQATTNVATVVLYRLYTNYYLFYTFLLQPCCNDGKRLHMYGTTV